MRPGRKPSPSTRLRVLVNAAAVRTGGGATLVVSQVTALARRPDLDLTVVAAGDVAARLERVGGVRVRRPPTNSMLVRLLWEHLVLSLQARHFAVLYCAGNFALPLARVSQVVTMQNALHFGDAARQLRRGYPRRLRVRLQIESALARLSARSASAVVAVSESLRAAMEQDVGQRQSIRVIASAMPVLPQPRACGEPRPYVLSVADDHPHKDWDALVALFSEHSDLPPLVAVGAFVGARRQRLEQIAAPGRVRFRGVVDDAADLAGLYASAACCVVHSRLESFGFTPLEAMAAGVPVVASDIPAHREVCGDDVLYYDPNDMGELGRLVRQAVETHWPVTSSPLRMRPWTWDENAAELAAVLHAAAGQSDSATARSRAMQDGAEK